MLLQKLLIPSSTIFRHIRVQRCYSAQKTIKELCEPINPKSFINIRSAWNLRIRPYDLLDCQDGNLIRASLVPIDPAKNAEEINANVYTLSIGSLLNLVEIDSGLNSDLSPTADVDDVLCILEVPVKSNLNIRAGKCVDVENHGGILVNIESMGDIRTKNMQQANSLKLESRNGNIVCDGNTLSNDIKMRVYGDNNISINKAQGDRLEALCETGKISTQSCYVEESKFVAIQGHLDLKNVHKQSEIHLPDGGSLNVTGFHGTLSARTRGGKINYQLTELYGDSLIQADSAETLTVNISEFVEEHTYIHAEATEITLHDTLANMKLSVSGGFESGDSENEDKLRIISTGLLNVGKLSWLEAMKLNTTN